MIKSSLTDDLSTLLAIQKLTFEKLSNYAIECISYDLQEAKLSGETSFSVDVGIGSLIVNFTEDEIKFRFNPSCDFENALVSVIKDGKEKPIVDKVEQSVVKRLLTSYKELF